MTSKQTQEIKKILQGLDGLKIVGADIVEVAPGEFAISATSAQSSLFPGK
jgi:hypothetical protein